MKIKWTLCDSAYACFGFCGAVILAIEVSEFWGFGFPPVGWFPVAVLVAALVLSLICWRHWPLLFLSAISLVFAAIAAANDIPGRLSDIAAWIYGAVATSVPLWWFLLARSRGSFRPTGQQKNSA